VPEYGAKSAGLVFIGPVLCGGKKSTHYHCGKQLCSHCISQSVLSGLPPFKKCGDFDVYCQMDDGIYFPQIDHLLQIHQSYMNATFILTFRDMESWFRSVTNYLVWGRKPLIEMMMDSNIGGLPAGKGNSSQELSELFCTHVERVRKFVQEHPSHSLIEVDIENDDTGYFMEEIFGINQECWGHANANPKFQDEKQNSTGP
jgi:hypothetical protein